MTEPAVTLEEQRSNTAPVAANDELFATPVKGISPAIGTVDAPGLAANDASALAPSTAKQPAAEKGNWFHRNQWFTREPLTYTAYQFFRSTMATIPYGFAMAAVHHGMGFLRVWGEKTGLTPQAMTAGIAKFDEAMTKSSLLKSQMVGMTDPVKLAGLSGELLNTTNHIQQSFKPGFQAAFGRQMARMATSPFNNALQIAAGFTLFRFVGGLIKGQRDKMMNKQNTAEDTERETKNWWQNIKDMARNNWKAESLGTPIAALTLGFASANFKFNAHNTPNPLDGERWWQGVKRAVIHPEAKLIQNAAIWTIAYSIFFEASERLFKDMQLKRGKWQGNSNSLKNTPHDPNVGGYAADGHTHEFHQTEPPPKPKLDILTGDPSICRFLFRRVLPVAVGITAYAVLKRSAYLGVGGVMTPVTHQMADAGWKANTKLFLKNSWREGAATAMFGALWMATDAWSEGYDKFFAKLQGEHKQKPLTQEQSDNLGKLHQRLSEKEAAQGRAA